MNAESFSIGADHTRFTGPAVTLPVGYRSLSARYFHHSLPLATEVEKARRDIDKAIRAAPQLHNSTLRFNCADHFLKEIASVAGESARLTRQNIEQVFNRVAAVAAGSQRLPGEFPTDGEFIGYLLILRTLSEQLNIQDIRLTLKRPDFAI
ncbi:hypothetical protein [Shimwellia blattae]|uniref:Uncharacterized protein n=1 Tax=Shimwellia blattae (strain ATCC 29907 / DSM 4481 / JCM 1650 / NBRC 105725 / CDC 9005-74) TaxID=630626 RepID=I2B5T2_SHIBC|nr:hypothetical protein [Shimwellia blattae]AFJ45886.1 hypothetical protein EBL_c07630 [Shimwellia blattae DSM 4481 = NBRC 105725]GAB81646.1 hypothetical protein EB105725_15_00460 [Shimwellia blattae DSM 4481 = NBRC 105725]VDY63364.1 Uncharacterised protein [Shimwellia blattae]VEC21186.1 Uncharacterised protein [Shimwellia blattae]